MATAKELADRLRHPVIEAHLGAYFLGSTAPDVHVITRWERERTHFFDLDNSGEQSGTDGLFEAYPELARPGRLNPSTVAFLAGYISHLAMDEVWIVDIYRPFFGERSALKGDVRANVMDRVLQYEIDRRERAKTELMAHVRDELLTTPLETYIGFIDRPTLERWRQISAEVASHPPDWDRFRMIAGRSLKAYGVATPEAVQEFMKNVPELLAEAIHRVSGDRVQAFLNRTIEDSLDAIKGYLS
jgi:hypothetical protein